MISPRVVLASIVLLAACATGEPAVPDHVEYVVVKGDTLGVIAKQYGVSVDDLRAWNGIEGDRIEIGHVLVVKVDPSGAPVAEAPKKKRPKKKLGGTTLTGSGDAGTAPTLAMPPEQPCLPPPDVTEEEGMASSAGLTLEQLRGAMGGFVGNTLACFPADTPSGTVDVSITVACTGRVARVEVLDGGGLPDSVTGCVRDTLGYAPFPAHDIPDGFTFEYPLRFEAP